MRASGAVGRERAFGVGIEKVLTPAGEVSWRAIPRKFGPHSLRRQWSIGEGVQLICVGNARDNHLEKLWNAQEDANIWGRIMALGFDAATSLNFSIYLDDPRLEHLINIKRTWLTVRQMQATSTLTPIPHLQWATLLDLERQLDYVQAQGFYTLTLNLQMVKRQGWDTVAEGLALIGERAPDLHFLFAGVAGLKRMAEVAEFFPDCSQVAFTNTNAHYLAEHYICLRRAATGPVEGLLEDHPDLTRLIKEPVSGHPDRILLNNMRLYQGFLAEIYGPELAGPRMTPPEERRYLETMKEICTALATRFGFPAAEAHAWADRLATDEKILYAFQAWLRSSQVCGEVPPKHVGESGRAVDPSFGGSFPTWPYARSVPHHPTLGELLDVGKTSLEAFLHLAGLAQRVYEEIEVSVGQAGY